MVVLVPYWPKQRWFEELFTTYSAQVMLKVSGAHYRKEGAGELLPVGGWETNLLKSYTTFTPSPVPRKFLTKGESETRSFVLNRRSDAYSEEVSLSVSTGLYTLVTQCELGLVGQLPVRVRKGGRAWSW